jgi:enoyl-CoA hydratase/carnithine racemase
MYQEIIDALTEAQNDNKISICCLTGNGKFFSSGNDITNYLKPKDNESQEQLIENGVNSYGYAI